ncbi:MAG: protein-disulfide reductase DsbD N-terminal domain-containing protein [Mucilaginibacter sp.]
MKKGIYKFKLFTIAVFASILLLSGNYVFAQIVHPVKWSYAAKKTGNGTATVFLKADIEDGWHIYSTRQAPGGPVKTSFKFLTSKNFAVAGTTIEPKPETKFENAFGINVKYFEHSVIFQQNIRLKGQGTTVKGELEYMACNDEKCLPPETVSFNIPVK